MQESLNASPSVVRLLMMMNRVSVATLIHALLKRTNSMTCPPVKIASLKTQLMWKVCTKLLP